MGLKEVIQGRDWDKKTLGEKLARLSKIADLVTIFSGLLLLGFTPALATTLIQASLITYAGGEIYEQHQKRSKKKS